MEIKEKTIRLAQMSRSFYFLKN